MTMRSHRGGHMPSCLPGADGLCKLRHEPDMAVRKK